MALTKATVARPASGVAYRPSVITATFDASYPTGGFALAASDFGFQSSIATMDATIVVPSANCAYVRWNSATAKLMAYTSAAAEVAAAVDLSALVVQCSALGY